VDGTGHGASVVGSLSRAGLSEENSIDGPQKEITPEEEMIICLWVEKWVVEKRLRTRSGGGNRRGKGQSAVKFLRTHSDVGDSTPKVRSV